MVFLTLSASGFVLTILTIFQTGIGSLASLQSDAPFSNPELITASHQQRMISGQAGLIESLSDQSYVLHILLCILLIVSAAEKTTS